MAGMTECLYEILKVDGDAVACILPPQNLGAGATTTPTIDMSTYRRVLFAVLGGASANNNDTLDIVVHQCTQANDAGGDAKVLAGKRGSKVVPQVLSGAGFATLNDLWLIEVRAEEMDVNNGFGFLLLSITVSAGDTWYLAAVAIRDVRGYEPVPTTNVTLVVD